LNANVRYGHIGDDRETNGNEVGVKWIHTDQDRNHRQDYHENRCETSGSLKGGEFLHLIHGVCYIK